MTILLTDALFKKKAKNVIRADREDLWREIHEIASFFALIGAIPEALSLWEFMYSGKVPLPDPDDRTISVFGDGAISALCYQLHRSDISKGKPPPQFAGRQHKIALTGTLEERVAALDGRSRERITGDAFSQTCDWESPDAKLLPTAIYRKARLLAQPRGGKYPATELEGLSLLTGLFNDPKAIATLHPCYQAAAFLLASDIAARHDRAREAICFLAMWHDMSIEWDYSVGEAFGLISVAGLLCEGVLSKKHKLRPNTREGIVNRIIADLSARLTSPEPPKPAKWTYKIYVSYSQFYLEPLKENSHAVYFQERGESEQGFSSFPRQVAFGTPDDSDECKIEVGFGKKLPSVESAVQAVAVPLTVDAPGGLYLRTVNDSSNKRRLDVPQGEYDVVARFYARTPKGNAASCFSSWRVALTFLPRGTVGAKCLKTFNRSPPDAVVVHGERPGGTL